jgi:hypothetical protein
MLKRQVAFMTIAILLATMAVPATAQNGTPPQPGMSVPISGNAKGGGNLTGTFTILQFVRINDDNPNLPQIGAFGTLVARTARGDTLVSQIVMPVVARAGAATATPGPSIQQVCEILDLTLGPLDLNLAGLEVHLDTVHLLIEANPAGGLLGQLLSGLLCGGNLGGILSGLIQDIIDFLNQILGILSSV